MTNSTTATTWNFTKKADLVGEAIRIIGADIDDGADEDYRYGAEIVWDIRRADGGTCRVGFKRLPWRVKTVERVLRMLETQPEGIPATLIKLTPEHDRVEKECYLWDIERGRQTSQWKLDFLEARERTRTAPAGPRDPFQSVQHRSFLRDQAQAADAEEADVTDEEMAQVPDSAFSEDEIAI